MTEEINNEAEKHFNNTKGRYDELLLALALETNQEITDKHKVLIIEDDAPSSLMRAELTKTFGEDIIIISQKDLSEDTKKKLPMLDSPRPMPIKKAVEPFMFTQQHAHFEPPLNRRERRLRKRKGK